MLATVPAVAATPCAGTFRSRRCSPPTRPHAPARRAALPKTRRDPALPFPRTLPEKLCRLWYNCSSSSNMTSMAEAWWRLRETTTTTCGSGLVSSSRARGDEKPRPHGSNEQQQQQQRTIAIRRPLGLRDAVVLRGRRGRRERPEHARCACVLAPLTPPAPPAPHPGSTQACDAQHVRQEPARARPRRHELACTRARAASLPSLCVPCSETDRG